MSLLLHPYNKKSRANIIFLHKCISIIEPFLIKIVDVWFSIIPRGHPAGDLLKEAKIIAHRGAHQSPGIRENSIEAFERAVGAGVYGIELDVQWSKDNVPIVFHDEDLKRVFGLPPRVEALEYERLRGLGVPSVREVVSNYRDRCHLFIDIKCRQGKLAEKNLKALLAVFNSIKAHQRIPFIEFNPPGV